MKHCYAVARAHKGSTTEFTFVGLSAQGEPTYVSYVKDACAFTKREDAERWKRFCFDHLRDYPQLGAWEVRELPL